MIIIFLLQILNGVDEMESPHSKSNKGGIKNLSSNHNPSNSNISRTNGNLLESNKKQDSANNNIISTCEICERGDFASEAELAAHRKLVHHVKSSSSGKVIMNIFYVGNNTNVIDK